MTFDELCDKYENLNNETFSQMVNEKLNAVIPKLDQMTLTISDKQYSGKDMLVYILLAAIVTDYSVSDSEVNFLTTILRAYINPRYDYPTTKDLIMNAGKSIAGYQSFADMIIDCLGKIESQLKADLVVLCILLSSVDGTISQSERKFLIRLLG